jgi:hypothetical protein
MGLEAGHWGNSGKARLGELRKIEKSLPSSPSGTVLTQVACLVISEQQESILSRLERGIYVAGFGIITIPALSPPK